MENKDFFGKKTGSVKVFIICPCIFFVGLFRCLSYEDSLRPWEKGRTDFAALILLAVLAYGIVNLLRAWDNRKKMS